MFRVSATGALAGPFVKPRNPHSRFAPFGNLVAGHDGSVWFDDDRGEIGRIGVDGSMRTILAPDSTLLPYPAGLFVAGSDHKVWFSGYGRSQAPYIASVDDAGHLVRYPLQTPVVSTGVSSGIGFGHDGALYFVVGATRTPGPLIHGALARLTTQGEYSQTPLPLELRPDSTYARDREILHTCDRENSPP